MVHHGLIERREWVPVADDIFREVDDAMRMERLRKSARRFAGLGLAGLVLIGAGIGGWEYHLSSLHKDALAKSTTYMSALHDLGADSSVAGTSLPLTPAQQKALTALAEVGNASPSGLATLAQLREAASYATHGKTQEALRIWDSIQQNTKVDATLRHVATLLWCQWQVDSGDIATIRSRLSLLSNESKPFAALANEQLATLDLRAGDVKAARDRLTRLQQDFNAPNGVRMRAGGMLQTLDQQG